MHAAVLLPDERILHQQRNSLSAVVPLSRYYLARVAAVFFDMQQVVRLLGDLGERYGAEHVYHNLRTPADAIKLLCINYPEFRDELLTAHEKGVAYRVMQAGVDLGIGDLELPIGQNDLVITPVLTGSDFGDVGNFLLELP